MSIPHIPGFTEQPPQTRLADAWKRPDGAFPEQLWPGQALGSIVAKPSGWVTVEAHYYSETSHGGRGCVLVPRGSEAVALADTSWVGRDLGTVSVWDSGRMDTGLVLDDEPRPEFFVQARRPSGAPIPEIDLSYPFQWFWDAFRVADGWRYVNRAGREQDLVRFERSEEGWQVDVRALELRTFLDAADRAAVIQVNHVEKMDHPEFERVDDEYKTDWAHFDFHVLYETAMGSRPAYSKLLGQYIISGGKTSRVPRWEERREDANYPSFIYGMDAESGAPLTHTCNPDALGTYFDKDGRRLHYLTPIYFKREVLQPYASEPSRYHLSTSRLSCLDLWGLDISINSVGLVEVYLGDLGRDLPSDEWGHWRTYNVPPEGRMDEGRFRRDFLNQWASSEDLPGELRRSHQRAVESSARRFGQPLWRPLPAQLRREYESMIGPLTDDPAALGGPLLILTKALIDTIDPAPIKAAVTVANKGEGSLTLLQRLLSELGDEGDSSRALRDVQAFRSRGGVAHLTSTDSRRAAAALGIDGLGSMDAFDVTVKRLIGSLDAISALLETEQSG